MKSTTEVLVDVGEGLDRQSLYYIERRRMVVPTIKRLRNRDYRSYDDDQVELIRNIWRYRKQGFTWDVAHQKALDDAKQPQILK